MMSNKAMPKLALITGAAHRLGRAMTWALAEDGYGVALHYKRSAQAATELAHEIVAQGGRAEIFEADLSSEDEMQALVPRVVKKMGPLGVLVNNAAQFERDEALTADRAGWDLHMEANLRAPFVLCQNMARLLPQGSKGLIVNIIDQRVWNLTPHFTTYTLSKVGLWALTQTLALALAPAIRVAAIGPGPALPSVHQSDEQFARQAARTPLSLPTSPDEIASALRFILASPSYTGQMIALDGGQHLDWAPGGIGADE
jgi:NAD(P)-dependent dehydrogenase (short-subunit alcohol dehydrogenase family)